MHRSMLARGERPSTDLAHGRAPAARSAEEHVRMGCINLDKPAGPTSHQVAAWLKEGCGLEKVGHGGTLDPNVTGVLPVALLDATRVIKTLLEAPKEYVCIVETHAKVEPAKLRETLERFRGPIYQIPPLKSAVKRELRVREIYALDVLEVDERRALFRVSCEAGTYIRKICTDVGVLLGAGASMLDLRRSRTGPFTEATAVSLHDVRDAFVFWRESADESELRRVVRPVEELVAHLPRVVVRDSAVDALCHGAALAVPGVVEVESTLEPGALAAVFTLKGELVAVGRAEMTAAEIAKRENGVALRTSRVVMDPGTYPRGWSKRGETKSSEPEAS
ncbi:MAG: RNA-guided pseudouridylation complex pseudouridine synthase subunit Cbf5 [Thermoplasmatota archaeon]